MGKSIHHICASIASFIVAFIYSWDMTLVMLATRRTEWRCPGRLGGGA